MLGVVGSNLKMAKNVIQSLRIVHDVVVVWPGHCNSVVPRHANLFDFQSTTCRNALQQGDQTNNVATVWPELANSETAMFG